MNPPVLSTTALALIARLQQHPELYDHLAALLDEVENRAGSLNTADEAEDAIVERMRRMGQQALTRWGEQRHATVQPAPGSGLRPAGKKKSAG